MEQIRETERDIYRESKRKRREERIRWRVRKIERERAPHNLEGKIK